MEALEETKDVILAQEAPPLPRRPSVHGNDDTHLQILQLLSAHMKLLLDAPEHLWRLIERKKYFPAAWLFLLARVVHRALVRDDEQDEGTWSSQGLDVLEQFPLVQRQWDAVSQFRSQIIHKATMSLREHNTSTEDTCATLLTLHLLDSRPLTETLSVLLGQRSKTLHTMLSWTSESSDYPSPHGASYSRQTNGHVPEKLKLGKSQTGFRRIPIREVKQATQTALDAISRTVKVARSIFQDDSSQRSMIGIILEYIQSDSPDPSAYSKTLPSELQLTTQTLLMTLPSSTHFLLLPPNLRFYKPYVDLASSSSFVPQAQFAQKLDEWFLKSTKNLQTAVQRWFSDLQSVKEVWNIRSSIWKWISSSSGLGAQETARLKSIFDDVCHKRVIGIWKLALVDAEKAFRDQLSSAASGLREGLNTPHTDSSPVEFLFQAPPLPVLSQAGPGPGLGPVDTSFQKYKATLRRQLVGRTSLLNDVLTTLERCARTLQQDLSHVLAGDSDNAPILVEKLTEAYRPDAESLCCNVVGTLDAAAEKDAEASVAMNSLVFIGRVADELASQSPFVSNIGCGENVAKDFQKKTRALHDRIIDRWRKHTISRIVQEHRLTVRPSSRAFTSTLSLPSAPSSDLVQSLLSLSNAIQQLGFPRDPARQNGLVDKTLRLFITNLVGDGWEHDGLQTLYDLEFLRRLADLWGGEWLDICELLGEQTLRVREMYHLEDTTGDGIEFEHNASEYLARTQILFGTLLPHPPMVSVQAATTDKYATLLPFGSPALDQKFHPAIALAKPSSRFGLLLVGGK